MRTVEINAIECDSFADAVSWAEASGQGRAITVGGMYLVAKEAECDRIAAAGVEFAYLHYLTMPDGSARPCTVPVN